jgi:hypothetical protein
VKTDSSSISENAFPNRPRRGRPPLSEDSYAIAERFIAQSEIQSPPVTRRGRQNYVYVDRASKALLSSYDQSLRYLFKPEPRRTILAAIGRIEDPDKMRVIAKWICEKRITTTKAVALALRARGKTKPSDPVNLSRAIFRTIEKYRARHPNPELSKETICAALEHTGLMFYTL